LNMLIQQNEMLKQKEIEKIQAIYKTREQERLRIANDLHDDIGASLSSLQIYGTIAEQAIETNPGKAVEMIHKISAQSKVLLENMSDIVWSMKSARDNTTTLEAKIKNFGVELLIDKNIDFGYHISTDAEAALRGIAVRKNILLLIKEAMNNMAKYSAAKTASLKMGIKNNNLALEITDNGIGFDIEKTAAGNGLKSMEYRIKELKGSLVISSIPGQGTSITALVPLIAINEIN
jgi:signal transduction histidine kinase